MKPEEAKEIYNELFQPEDKIKAFDKIAEKYYFSNFGSISKTDFETLMFSIYIEQLLEKNQEDYNSYSDYTLSKVLGITQSKVSNLKVRKELLYPYDKFEWKDSLLRIAENVVFEDNRIKLHIPDRNVFLELKNAIEVNGGFIDVQLNKNLLQVRLQYFLDLLVAISEEEDREKIKKVLEKTIKKNNIDVNFDKKKTFGQALMKQAPDVTIALIESLTPEPIKFVAEFAKIICTAVKEYKN